MNIEKIYFDLDGVFADFTGGVERICGFRPSDNQDDTPENEEKMWTAIRDADHFYRDLPTISGSVSLFHDIYERFPDRCAILTGVPKPRRGIETAVEDKKLWVSRNLSEDLPVLTVFRVEKLSFSAPGCILIDDYLETIQAWEERGGIGIHFRSAEEVREKLEELGILGDVPKKDGYKENGK